MKNKIEQALASKKPFVFYKMPNETTVKTLFQEDDFHYFNTSFSSDGFVFAPFNNSEKTLSIPFSKAEKKQHSINDFTSDFISKTSVLESAFDTDSHEELVQKGVDFIKKTEVSKIVLAREEKVDLESLDLLEIYQKLLSLYPTAYVYFWYHPLSGIWMGATPEILIKTTSDEFKIMALASTQEYRGTLDVNWNKKELEEHQIVVNFITDAFKNTSLNVSETYTVNAGNLVHLRTDISGEKENDFDLKSVIEKLHPTPATCGLPKEKAKEFILKNEHFNRQFYTGFLGETSAEKSDLFVNLRCMKIDIENKQAHLFVGGGITKDSIPKKEWEETVSKSQVMKKVL